MKMTKTRLAAFLVFTPWTLLNLYCLIMPFDHLIASLTNVLHIVCWIVNILMVFWAMLEFEEWAGYVVNFWNKYLYEEISK